MTPNIGYPDYQRVVNWDSGVIWQLPEQVITSAVTSNVMDVSRYGCLGGLIVPVTNDALITLRWFLDDLGLVGVGSRQFAVTPNIQNYCQIRFPNLGPFIQIEVSTFGGVNATISANFFATNRADMLELVPAAPQLVPYQGVSVPTTQGVTLYPLDYYSGPARVWIYAASPAVAYLDGCNAQGQYGHFDQTPTVSGGAASMNTIIPPGSWRIGLVNGGTATQTIQIAITQSYTGSS